MRPAIYRLAVLQTLLIGLWTASVEAARYCDPSGVCYDDGYAVYTPNGTPVPVLQAVNDYTPAQKSSINFSVMSAYPFALLVADATTQYNCHAYAWFMYYGGPVRSYWMNNPSSYWGDGSYRFITSDSSGSPIPGFVPDGTRVSYVGGDHSAVKIYGSRFESKWGRLPRMQHSPAYTPYSPSSLAYYQR